MDEAQAVKTVKRLFGINTEGNNGCRFRLLEKRANSTKTDTWYCTLPSGHGFRHETEGGHRSWYSTKLNHLNTKRTKHKSQPSLW